MTDSTNSHPIIYGPIESRRLGLSLGVNILGNSKACSLNCPYCDLGQTELRMNKLKTEGDFVNPEVLKQQLHNSLLACITNSKIPDYITLSGNGEPTLHPQLTDCIDAMIEVRNHLAPTSKLAILSNGAHLDLRKTIIALNKLDERFIKIDAGNEEVFKKINQPLSRTTMSRISSNIRKLDDVIIQSCFVQGVIDNTGHDDIEEWLEVVGLAAPKEVHIYSISRPAWTPGLVAPDEDTLYSISARLKRRLQIDSKVF